MSRSPQKLAQEFAKGLQQQMSAEQRLNLLRRSTGIREEDVEDYRKTEVLRSAIDGVRKTAAVHQVTRTSPKKIYSGVKSKVSGNIKSIKKSQKRAHMATTIAKMKDEQKEEAQNPYVPNVRQAFSSPQRKIPSVVPQSSSSTEIRSIDLPSATAKTTASYKSQMAKDQMEAIIAGIKAKYSQQHIAEMSQDQLQTEVMNEIMQNKQQNRKFEK